MRMPTRHAMADSLTWTRPEEAGQMLGDAGCEMRARRGRVLEPSAWVPHSLDFVLRLSVPLPRSYSPFPHHTRTLSLPRLRNAGALAASLVFNYLRRRCQVD